MARMREALTEEGIVEPKRRSWIWFGKNAHITIENCTYEVNEIGVLTFEALSADDEIGVN